MQDKQDFDTWFRDLITLVNKRTEKCVRVDRFAVAHQMFTDGLSTEQACEKIVEYLKAEKCGAA